MNQEPHKPPEAEKKKSGTPIWEWAFILVYALTVSGLTVFDVVGPLTWLLLLVVGGVALILMRRR